MNMYVYGHIGRFLSYRYMNQPNIWNASDPYPNYGSRVDLNYSFKRISTDNVGGTNITGTKTANYTCLNHVGTLLKLILSCNLCNGKFFLSI